MGHAGFQDAVNDFYAFVNADHVFVVLLLAPIILLLMPLLTPLPCFC